MEHHQHVDAVPVDNIQVCRICFATDCKIYSMTSYRVLNAEYETLTGIMTADEEHLPRYLCAGCADRLMNCARFRRRSLRAHLMLLDIVRRHGHITVELIRSDLQNHNPLSSDPADNPIEEHFGFDTEDLEEIIKQTDAKEDGSTENTDVYKNLNDDKFTFDQSHINGEDSTNDVAVNEVKTENEDSNNEEDVIGLCLSNLEDIVCDGIIENSDMNKLNVKMENSEVIDKNNPNNEQTASHIVCTGEDILDDLFTQIEGLRVKKVKKTRQDENEVKIDKQQTPEADGLSTDDTLRCDICSYQTNSDIQFLEHLKAHANKKSYFCDVCGYNTDRKNALISHMRTHLDSKVYSCNFCERVCKYKAHFKIHMRRHTGEKPYSCTTCNVRFCSTSSRNKHMKIHSRKKHSCNVCNKEFSQINHLRSHLVLHTGGKPYLCKICKKRFRDKTKLQRHLPVHSDEKPFSCHICKKTFKRKCNLLLHSVVHYGKKPYACDICTETFNDGNSLKSHLKLHSPDESYYICEICKRVIRQKHIKDHLKIHSDEKSYSCDICKKTFRRKDHLLSHSAIHSDEKPYSCDICGTAFKLRYSLISHFSIHSSEKPYSCHICQKAFRLKSLLKGHLAMHLSK